MYDKVSLGGRFWSPSGSPDGTGDAFDLCDPSGRTPRDAISETDSREHLLPTQTIDGGERPPSSEWSRGSATYLAMVVRQASMSARLISRSSLFSVGSGTG